MIEKLRKNRHEISLELRSFRNDGYPDFVTSSSPTTLKNHIPVFMFHSINHKIFEEQLRFLSENGYRTITCDEFYEIITQQIPVSEKTVLLTIDDGKSSVWVYAYPLLKKYGFKATVFLIPGYMKESDEYLLNLEDFWQGRCRLEDLKDRDADFFPLLTWEETTRLHESRVLDFQCHTLYHHKIYTDEKIVDFFNPIQPRNNFNLILPKDYENQIQDNDIQEFYGMPIYENDSLMAAKPRLLHNVRLTELCVDHVFEHGGEKFFERTSWRQELSDLVENFRKNSNDDLHGFQSPGETKLEIFENLSKAKELIQKKLRGKKVTHLCHPYGIGSEIAIHESKKTGYVTNFWAVIPGKPLNQPGNDPFYCSRLKDDYIFRLPGMGRKSLSKILLQKLRRRLGKEALY